MWPVLQSKQLFDCCWRKNVRSKNKIDAIRSYQSCAHFTLTGKQKPGANNFLNENQKCSSFSMASVALVSYSTHSCSVSWNLKVTHNWRRCYAAAVDISKWVFFFFGLQCTQNFLLIFCCCSSSVAICCCCESLVLQQVGKMIRMLTVSGLHKVPGCVCMGRDVLLIFWFFYLFPKYGYIH